MIKHVYVLMCDCGVCEEVLVLRIDKKEAVKIAKSAGWSIDKRDFCLCPKHADQKPFGGWKEVKIK